MDNEWKHSLRDRMEDYAEPAPEGLWKAISESSEFASLVSDGKAVRPEVRKGKFIGNGRLWFGLAGGIAAVFVLLLLLWRPEDSGLNGGSQELVALAEPVDTEIDVNPFGRNVPALASLQERSADVPATPGMTVAVSNMAEGVLDMTDKYGIAEKGNGMAGIEPDMKEPDAIERGGTADGSGPDMAVGVEEKDRETMKEQNREWDDALDVVETQKGRGRWSAGLLASNIPMSSSSRAGEAATPVRVQQTGADFVAGSLADVRTFNTTRETSTSYKHYQPIKVGLSVRYYISRSWSVETGLTYSYLYSKLRSGSDDYYDSGVQTLHYIGVPLNFNFNIWSSRRLTAYASAGGLMEKCVGGNLRSTSYFNGAKGDTGYENVMVKPLQWSVSASLGLQYNLSHLLGIYLEPGAAYYFSNGSPVETFYSCHPLNFNLELGLRFSF